MKSDAEKKRPLFVVKPNESEQYTDVDSSAAETAACYYLPLTQDQKQVAEDWQELWKSAKLKKIDSIGTYQFDRYTQNIGELLIDLRQSLGYESEEEEEKTSPLNSLLPKPDTLGVSLMDPKDERYLDARLKSIETSLNEGQKHQAEILDIHITDLRKVVESSITESAAIKKEFYDNNRWWLRSLWVGILGVVGLFAGMLYFMGTLNNNMSKEMLESRKENIDLRKDFQRFQHDIQSDIQKIKK